MQPGIVIIENRLRKQGNSSNSMVVEVGNLAVKGQRILIQSSEILSAPKEWHPLEPQWSLDSSYF